MVNSNFLPLAGTNSFVCNLETSKSKISKADIKIKLDFVLKQLMSLKMYVIKILSEDINTNNNYFS